MLIRKIVEDDNAAVADVIRSVMTEHGAVGEGFSIQDAEVDTMYQAYQGPRTIMYVIEHQAEVAGCGGLGPLVGGESNVCELKKMYFKPQIRGQGLGRILGEMLIVDARRLGYRQIYIETLASMQAANQLYQKLGFERRDEKLGDTGHCGCDTFYDMHIDAPSVDPSLLA